MTPIEAADIEEWNFGSFEGFDGGIWVNNELIPYTAGKSSLKEMTFAEIADAFHAIDTLVVADIVGASKRRRTTPKRRRHT